MTDKNYRNQFRNSFLNYWPLLGYLLISIFFLFPVLRQSGVPLKYDWGWPLFDMKEYWSHLFDASSLGLLAAPGKYAVLILGLPGVVKLAPSVSLKLFLLAIHTIAGYSFYLFVYRRTESKLISFVTGLAYAFSPYIFIRTIVGFIYSLIAYACLPLFLYFYFSHKKKNYLIWILLGFLLSLIFAQIQAGLLISLILSANLFVSIFSKKFFIRLKSLALIFLFFLAVNIPWLILFYVKKSDIKVVSGSIVTTLNFIALLPHSFRNIFMLSDHHITADFYYTLSHDKLFLAGWLIVWFVAFCAIFNKKNRELVLTFIISSLLVLPFVKGPIGFFGRFYIWFYNHIPQIAVFRETYHFEFLYAISLCVLFAFGLDWIWQKITNRQTSITSRYPITIKQKNPSRKETAKIPPRLNSLILTGLKAILAASALFIIAPYFTFNYAGYFELQPIPSVYFELNDFFKENKHYCSKIYYPPGSGFLYFKGDQILGASNSDVLASSLPVRYLSGDISVLNLPSEEMFYRNQVISQFYESEDIGEFVNLLAEGGIDCVVVRQDIESKYFESSNLWREKDSKIYKKWMNPDMLTLVKNKKGLIFDRQFGSDIYIFKPQTSNLKLQTYTSKSQNLTSQPAIQQFSGLAIDRLPITDWANNYAYYKDGWSRGRYDFWRKHLFTQLRQDFLYTDTATTSTLSAKIEQRGSYEVWIRYMTGGQPGNFKLQISNVKFEIQKESGEEKFVWRKLGDVDITDGKVKITNISGENAIADIVLVKK